MNILNFKDNRAELIAMYQNSYKQIPVPKEQPKPNRFFSPIEDNRDLILAQLKREQEMKLELRMSNLPERR